MKIQTLDVFYPLFTNDKRVILSYGGAGSGKSTAAALNVVVRCLNEQGRTGQKHKYLVIRKVAASLRDSCVAAIEQHLKEMEVPYFKKHGHNIYLRNGASIIFKGIDDPEKLKSISAISSIWIEEGTELTKDDFDQLNLRLRDDSGLRHEILMTFNPTTTQSWIYKDYFQEPSPEILEETAFIHSNYLDNEFLSDDYVAVLDRNRVINPEYYEVYTLGNWGSLKGAIYNSFKQTVDFPPDGVGHVCYGLDFGYNNPSALVKIQTVDGIHYLRELLYQTGLTSNDLIQRMANMGIKGWEPIYCDSADPAKIEDLYRAGFNAKPADKDVKAGIDFVLKRKPFIRTHPSNHNLNSEATAYRWELDKNKQPLDRPEKKHDHIMDALRYALYTQHKTPSSGGRALWI
jgi:phage terminase large subunit